ncbi:MAG: hypothetical protein ACYTGX_18650, partial [Planctomycetota bacterium]
MRLTRPSLLSGILCAAALLCGCEAGGDTDGGPAHHDGGEHASAPADAGEAWSNEPSPLVWTAAWVAEAPTLDGSLEGAWEQAT